jgi:ketosteroid isomerase-like protein
MIDRTRTVQELYCAFATGDASTLQALLAEPHWAEATGMPQGGTYRGFGEIAASVLSDHQPCPRIC